MLKEKNRGQLPELMRLEGFILTGNKTNFRDFQRCMFDGTRVCVLHSVSAGACVCVSSNLSDPHRGGISRVYGVDHCGLLNAIIASSQHLRKTKAGFFVPVSAFVPSELHTCSKRS